MESTACPAVSSVNASDSANIVSPPMSENTEESEVSQNTQSTESSESPALLDPSLQRGRTPTRARMAMVSNHTQRVVRQFSQSRPVVPKPPSTNLSLLILTAVATCQKKSGLSMQALKKIVTSMGYDMAKKKRYFLRSIKSMVAKGQLWQVKGTGATGSFKVNPDLRKKRQQPKVKGRGQKAKGSSKKKNGPTRSRSGRNATKKQGKVDSSKRASNRSRMPSIQAVQSQVKV